MCLILKRKKEIMIDKIMKVIVVEMIGKVSATLKKKNQIQKLQFLHLIMA